MFKKEQHTDRQEYKTQPLRTAASRDLNIILGFNLASAALILVAMPLFVPRSLWLRYIGSESLATLSLFALWWLNRQGKTRLSGYLFVLFLPVFFTWGVPPEWLLAGPLLVGYALPIGIASLLLDSTASVIVIIITTILIVLRAITSVAADPALVIDQYQIGISLLMLYVLVAVDWRSARNALQALGVARQSEEETQSLNVQLMQSTQQLQDEQQQLAVHLTVTADVSRMAAEMLNLQQLLPQVTALLSQRLGFYHTGIFLLDATGEWAVLQAASSEGGQRMLARGHQLQVGGKSIVGYVTGRGKSRIALDVGKDAAFLTNPDLPETRSEIALPLRVRDEIIGALDVQSTEPEAFIEEDVAVLQTLTDQVAMAISNARLFQQTQETLEAERRAYGELGREAWKELLRTRPEGGFISDAHGVSPASDLWVPRMETALRTRKTTLGGKNGTTLATPIKVRDQVIGVLDAYKPDGARAWTSEEIALLETLTDQLGTALESARLYQDTQRRAIRERLTGEITARMRETLDMETVLQTAAREIGQALGLAALDVRLGVEDRE